MPGKLFIAPGDITQLHVDAVAFSTSTMFAATGDLYSAFRAHVPGFAERYAELGERHSGKCQAGDTFWVPLSSDQKPYGVVVVATEGSTVHPEDRAARAVRAALEAAVTHLRNDGKKGRLLVALPTFRVGTGGARRDRLNAALEQVRAAKNAMDRLPDVDVAFIAYTPSVYHIFLDARREVLKPHEAAPDIPGGLAQALCAGECVTFIGAGLSRAASLPDWSQLIDRLARDLEIPNIAQIDYLDIAQWYREHFGSAKLAAVIGETFGPSHHRPTLAHYLLLSLPVRTVFTTNYDDLIERALEGLKHHPVRVVSQEDVPRTGHTEGVSVVKLHGDASRPEEIVLCRDDYDAFFEQRPAMALLLEGLLLNRTFFFIGYGLRDPNFRQLFSRIGRLLPRDRCAAFATAFLGDADGGPFLVKQWQEKGLHLIDMPPGDFSDRERDFLSFLDRLAEHVATRAPRLFLAPDVQVPERLTRLHDILSQEVGVELETLIRSGAASSELAPLADLLRYLTSQGWRSQTRLTQLWHDLAAVLPESAEKRRLLIDALSAAERFSDAENVRRLLTPDKSSGGTS